MDANARQVDRSGWDAGPWDGEPDRWDGEAEGFPLLALRSDAGNWCGYVAVPPGHPWHGKGYNDMDVSVHGGPTYANACAGHICHVPKPGEPDDVWWIGFDCHHPGDYAPSTAVWRKMSESPALWLQADDEYRTLEYVQQECRALARQAKEAT